MILKSYMSKCAGIAESKGISGENGRGVYFLFYIGLIDCHPGNILQYAHARREASFACYKDNLFHFHHFLIYNIFDYG